MRQIASLVAGATIAAVGGLVLGEYPFIGWTPYVAGVLFPLVVTEVMITVGRRHGSVLAGGGAVFSAAGLGWAVWISSGRGVAPIPGGGWIAIALGFTVAMARGLLPAVRPAGGGAQPARPETPTPPAWGAGAASDPGLPAGATAPTATAPEAMGPEAMRPEAAGPEATGPEPEAAQPAAPAAKARAARARKSAAGAPAKKAAAGAPAKKAAAGAPAKKAAAARPVRSAAPRRSSKPPAVKEGGSPRSRNRTGER